MALEDIIKKIQSDAEIEAKNILAQAQKEVDAINTQNQQDIKDFKSKFLSNTKQKAIAHAKSILISASNEQKTLLLKEKRHLLDNIYEQTLKKLIDIDDENYKKIITSFFNQVIAMGLDNLKIISPEKRLKQTQEVVEKLNIECQVQSDKDDNILAGFVAIHDQTKLDFSFQNILKEYWKEIEKKLSKKIF